MRASEGCSPRPVFPRLGSGMWPFYSDTSSPPTGNLLISHVFSATEKPTEGPTSTTDVINVLGEERSSGSWPLTAGAIVGVALASAVLIIAILGLMVYLRWKRSKGKLSKIPLSPQASQPGISLNTPASE